MKSYAVLQHTYSEFLGLIENQLEKRDIGFSYIRPFVGQGVPGSSLQWDGLFVLAGATRINDPEASPWADEEQNLITVFRKAKRPVVGLGYGALLIAQMEGGVVHDEPFHNAYWTTAHATEAGHDDELAQAVDGRRVFVMYNGQVDLPDGMKPILVDDDGRWLAIRPDELTYGLLFRPELKPGMIEDMIMEAEREVPDNIGELLAAARENWNEMQALNDQVIVALVKELDLMQERRKPPVFNLRVETKQ